jgi:hypothetical protein
MICTPFVLLFWIVIAQPWIFQQSRKRQRAKVQTWPFRVSERKLCHDPETLCVAFKPTLRGSKSVQFTFCHMAEGRMAYVVR